MSADSSRFWLESARWFCRDFDVDDAVLVELSVELHQNERVGGWTMRRIVEDYLDIYLEEWAEGGRMVSEYTRDRDTVGSRAGFLANRICSLVSVKERVGRWRDDPSCINYFRLREGGIQRFPECKEHAALWDQFIPADQFEHVERSVRSSWVCCCRLYFASEGYKRHAERKA